MSVLEEMYVLYEKSRAQYEPRFVSRPCPVCGTASEKVDFYTQDNVPYRQCDCGMVYAIKVMPKDMVAKFYWESGGHEQRVAQLREVTADTARFRRYLNRIVKYERGGLLIDAGTWTGHFMASAQQFGFTTKGYEVIPAAFEVAQSLGYDMTTGFFEDVCDITEEASVVTAWETLEHSSDARRFLQTIRKTLKPNGIVAITVPNWATPELQITKMDTYHFVGCGGSHWHINMFTPKTLRRFLESERFKVETIFTVGGTDIANVFSYFFDCDALNSYKNLVSGKKKDENPLFRKLDSLLHYPIMATERVLNIAPIIFAIARKTT